MDDLEDNILDTSTLIHRNQYNTEKQSLEKKIEEFDQKIPDVSGLVRILLLTQKLEKLRTKYPTIIYMHI